MPVTGRHLLQTEKTKKKNTGFYWSHQSSLMGFYEFSKKTQHDLNLSNPLFAQEYWLFIKPRLLLPKSQHIARKSACPEKINFLSFAFDRHYIWAWYLCRYYHHQVTCY